MLTDLYLNKKDDRTIIKMNRIDMVALSFHQGHYRAMQSSFQETFRKKLKYIWPVLSFSIAQRDLSY